MKLITDNELKANGVDVRIARFRQALDVEATERIKRAHKLPKWAKRDAIQGIHDWVNEMKQQLQLEANTN